MHTFEGREEFKRKLCNFVEIVANFDVAEKSFTLSLKNFYQPFKRYGSAHVLKF